ncbi:MAG TPA: hypothetical protein VGR43_02245 [Dehalococcoidia bacterium]|nr:hypothetical protein [Dehalococcoidia bacterium]
MAASGRIGEAMMTPNYRDFILEGLDGLPPEALAEIAGYIFLVRKRLLQPEAFDQELQDALLRLDLKHLGRSEEAHLEEEFEGYEQLHPRE